jgi:hypothetical protein
MKTIREIIKERLIQNKRLLNPSANEMDEYIIELDQLHDYDLLDEFELMLTETET